MSNGSQIGGVVGAAIGAYFGGATGAQWGYAIGSAVGGYVDPTRVYGPKLTDATAQTSTVGGPIPFGYGIFTTAGNIIWRDVLKEHRKSERAGKGSSQKNITYTYTRSYAIGVCEGPITEFVWVKRNGKIVYAAQPHSLGTAMGWNGKAINDLVAASAKFSNNTELYFGDGEQMPDATIVAVEGVGNVSAFRKLAYIVVVNDDLTDLQGAIPQYEFCVNATKREMYVTSRPYPIENTDSIALGHAWIRSGQLHTLPVIDNGQDDLMLGHGSVDGGELRSILRVMPTQDPAEVQLGHASVAGELKTILVTLATQDPAEMQLGHASVSGELQTVVIVMPTQDPANIQLGHASITGTLETI